MARRLLAASALSLTALALAAPAHAAEVDRLARISGASPFPGGCGVPGTRSRDSEAEPTLAVDPRDPRHLVTGWQADRFPGDGGAISDPVAVSHDGGRRWRSTLLPGVSRCTGGKDERTSDVWASIGGDGRVYVSVLTFTETPVGLLGFAGPTAQRVSTSTDGGSTFGRATTVVDQGLYDDRESIEADPRRPGRAYLVWVRRLGLLGESGVEEFSRTTDGGRSWSPPAIIQVPGLATLPDPTLLKVLPDGSLLNLYLVANGSPILKESLPATPLIPWTVMSSRSTDGGRTWSRPVSIARIASPVAPADPEQDTEVRAFPEISGDAAADGTAYVSWNEISSARSARIMVARSSDGGRSWGRPTAVAHPATQAFLPSLAVAGDGTVGVTWDDFRRDRPGDRVLTADVWYSLSGDGGRSWREGHLAGPFDMRSAPPTASTQVTGHFVGDYQALVGLPDGFAAAFAQAKPPARTGPADIFFAHVSLLPPRIRLSVRPRRVHAGRRVRLRFRAIAGSGESRRPVRGATVRFAGRRRRTGRDGRTAITLTLRHRGVRRARVSRRGYRSGTARVVAVR